MPATGSGGATERRGGNSIRADTAATPLPAPNVPLRLCFDHALYALAQLLVAVLLGTVEGRLERPPCPFPAMIEQGLLKQTVQGALSFRRCAAADAERLHDLASLRLHIFGSERHCMCLLGTLYRWPSRNGATDAGSLQCCLIPAQQLRELIEPAAAHARPHVYKHPLDFLRVCRE